MAPSPTAPEPSTTDEAEVLQTLTSNQDNDTEMADARGKNILNHMRSSSTESDKYPNSKPPNHREKTPLPPPNPETDHPAPRPRIHIHNTHNQIAPTTATNVSTSGGHPTHPTDGEQAPALRNPGQPPAPGPAPLTHPQQPPPPPLQELRPGRTPSPPPGFISATEMAAMKKFASERTQTLTQRVATKSTPNNNPLELTPCPEPEGFFVPQGEFSRWVIDNIHTDQIEEIGQQKGATVACIVEGENAHDGSRSSTIAAGLAREIKKLFPNEDPQVVPGMPATEPTKYSDPPYAYFVYGLSSDTYVQLTSRVAWRNRSIRFCAYALQEQHISFLGYISGFSNLLSDGAMTKVLTFLTKAFRNGEVASTLRDIIAGGETVDNAGDEIIIYPEEIDAVLDRLRIERIDIMREGGILQPSVNIYLPGAEYSDKQWADLRYAASRTSYAHPLFGIGKYYKGWTCGKCHGVTHPTGLCPFLHIVDDIPLTEPIVPPHTRTQNQTQNKRGGTPHGDSGVRRGRGKFGNYNGGR
jgi:hypothetical protein